MTNLSHKCRGKRHQKGAATLLMSVILLSLLTLIILFAASYAIMQQKITTNTYRYLQAYEAAEAGLEYAVPYLTKNRTAILANPISGFLAAYVSVNTQNVVLAISSKFTIGYTNPIANNYNLIKITVTGTSDDSSSVQTMSQLVQYDSYLITTPTSPLVAKGAVSLSGSSQVINLTSTHNITSGSTITIQGAANTTTSNPLITSTAASLSTDVSQNNSTLSGETESQLFASYFGVNETTFKNNVTNYYTNSSDTNYNSALNGKTNSIIWIDQTGGEAKIDGTTIIGSPTQPVIMIVNGNLRLSGTATIYGLVYVMQGTQTDALGSSNVIGAFVNAGSLSLAGSAKLTFNQAALTAIQQNIGYYAKVPGSWMDF